MNLLITTLWKIWKKCCPHRLNTFVFVAIMGIILCSCASMNTTIKTNPSALPGDEVAIYHAVLDSALDELSRQYNCDQCYACYIEMPKGKALSLSFLEAHHFKVPLRPASECRIKGQFNEVFDKKKNKKGVLIIIDEIQILSNYEAQSGFGWHINNLSGRGFKVKLNKNNDKWEVTEVKCWLMS